MIHLINEINSVLQYHFDKILVLTVPRFTQRHQTVKQKLEGISFDFFYGIDKYHLTKDYLKNHYCYDKNKTLSVTNHFPPLNKGEIACALSHKKIYRTMVENNWKSVL